MDQRSKTRSLFREIARFVAPPSDLTVSEWADRYRMLSSEASAEPGPWRTSRAPYQREPMNAITDLRYETIVFKWSAQVGKTEAILNAIGYFTEHDPSSIMAVYPTLEMARAFSKDRLAPMYRDSPKLKAVISQAKSRDSGNSILHKQFPGGQITLAGANSPASLASRPIRIALCDEIDRFPVSAGTEGDPVSLVAKRTTTFWNRKIIKVSTPTIKGSSRIEEDYEDSTMEEWCVPCPSCKEYQPFSWKQIKFEYDEERKKTIRVEHACRKCGALHNEQEWKAGTEETGKWVARKKHSTTRGFHLNELASTFSPWEKIVHNFKKAEKLMKKGDFEAMKVWVNTTLAEVWEEKGEKIDENVLMNRRELYHADVPEGVKVLTAAVDTQDNRFEVEVMGWGTGHESWRIQYHKIYGDLKQPQVWADLDEFLQRTWEDKEGRQFRIAITCMDSGGHFTNEVYKFCKERLSRRVFAIKGESPGNGTYLPLVAGTSTNNRYKATVVRLGVDEGKSKVMSLLQQKPGQPGYCHFPLTTRDKDRGYNEEYFDGLTAEEVRTRYKSGVPYQVWVKVRSRNEPLDLAVYNRAAIEILQPNLDKPLPPPGEQIVGSTPKPKRKRRGMISKGI
ncbi:phage terminase large subunit family protein [Paenibacillus larvae]|uniref:phage terminase large subunit family protein n=1 Tax=Paenibacillus larvae TaxID=1464 RepID=UPI0022810CC2|nr:phage terminase large subunit family protein [Paenibacillus larvae]MCY9710043.1 phage terminase large subunit family protein [Paenibacillus larvae]MCY9718951.1 phage terminase large subunit family protein [Paenibacillus larvae]